MRSLVLSLFVINLGVALGAGLYEARIVTPEWFRRTRDGRREWDPEAARRMDVGLRFWAYVTTLPLTLLTLSNIALAWTAPAQARGWWAFAVGAALLERLMTFGYFIPTMIRLTSNAEGVSTEATASAERWISRGHVRLAITALALGAALRTLVMAG